MQAYRLYVLRDGQSVLRGTSPRLSCIGGSHLWLPQVYSSNQAPFGPTSFLTTTWKVSAEMSGYSQQDAHEFFITALNQIHGTCRGSTNISCNCIIHQTFAGQLQSDVTCERCGNTTSTVDPMLDISLELRGKAGEVPGGENTLAGCLRRCVSVVHLIKKEYAHRMY